MLELKSLTRIAPEDVLAESRFLLEINFSNFSKFHIESQKYWILAVDAALTARRCQSALGARARQVKNKVNGKLPSQMKYGIVAIERQIRSDLCHSLLHQEEYTRYHTSTQLSLDDLFSKQPHPASIINLMKSNKCLRKLD
jgi:hypothetical protein